MGKIPTKSVEIMRKINHFKDSFAYESLKPRMKTLHADLLLAESQLVTVLVADKFISTNAFEA